MITIFGVWRSTREVFHETNLQAGFLVLFLQFYSNFCIVKCFLLAERSDDCTRDFELTDLYYLID